ncbi:TIGR03118 family protein [Burkholderia ubonensis]|uniref:TIGR03118 family protein n=1 Tax=Burkholderia ubonensis subsp. mesacidophila TaxID=265293 RepID=A0A2A4FC20_9BURK|nr:TIGR03118 family protein [Burkholderia ubonensis]PCE30685.1 TIGR03118 family protein [Burkholderia ubonensis subsp. mesacidophila]
MSQVSWGLKAAAVIALAAGFTIAHAADDDAYVVTPLVSNLAGAAPKVDPVLQNAWGVAFSPAGSPFWVNDNATGCATLYDGQGTKVPLQVSIPLPGNVIPASACHPVSSINPPNPAPAAPTGIVWNPSSAFLVPGTKIQAAFIFATEDGTLSAWAGGLNPADHAVLAADNSSTPSAASGAVYKGLAFGVNAKGPLLFATNFRAGRIDVFGPNGASGMFTPATTDGGFIDRRIPAGYAPFGIANIDGDLFVTYAQQDDQKHDDVAGNGHGFVDVFDTDGHLLRRFASQGTLDSPWGITRASFAFGRFSGKILIGNFGDGRIGVFDDNGRFVEQLENASGNPLAIDGLWTLTLGGGRNSSPDTVYFTAGPNKETNGLFGTIAPLNGAKGRRSDQNGQ